MYKKYLAVFILSTALISLPGLSGTAYAHDGEAYKVDCKKGERIRFTDSQRKLLRETMKKVHEESKEAFASLRQLHKHLHDLMKEETFNREDFLATTKEIVEKKSELAEKRIEAFASIADKFTPEQRKHLLKHLLHHHKKWHHHNRNFHGKFGMGYHPGDTHEGQGRENPEGSVTQEATPGDTEVPHSNLHILQNSNQDDYPPYNSR